MKTQKYDNVQVSSIAKVSCKQGDILKQKVVSKKSFLDLGHFNICSQGSYKNYSHQ